MNFIFPTDALYSLLKLLTYCFQLFLLCDRESHSSTMYRTNDITSDSYSLMLSDNLMRLFFDFAFHLPNTLLTLPILNWQSLLQLLLFVTMMPKKEKLNLSLHIGDKSHN